MNLRFFEGLNLMAMHLEAFSRFFFGPGNGPSNS